MADGCLFLEPTWAPPSTRLLVLWPHGSRPRVVDGTLVVTNEKGRVGAVVGRPFAAATGKGLSDDLRSAEVRVGPIPERCRTASYIPVWVPRPLE